MESFVPFWTLLTLSFFVFIIPKNHKQLFSLVLVSAVVAMTSYWGIQVLFLGQEITGDLPLKFLESPGSLIIDKLSAFFILVVNFTILTGIVYAKGYLRPYLKTKNVHQFSVHYFSYLWLYFAMLLVVMVRDGLGFLIVWELMGLSSFLLVMFDAEKEDVLKIGLNYMIQMHIGFLFLVFGFVIVGMVTNQMSFNAMAQAFSSEGLTAILGVHGNFWLFLIFFIGFGLKAGFIPLHTWLPYAHPAAPSHVSGVMSGVMIKMGIYGIFRVIISLHTDLMWVGYFLLIISIATGIFGIMMSIVQEDTKKLLAYSSIENIGIIGIGMALGVLGIGMQIPLLAVLGFSGSLLHILNHSLFKSILFYGAGSIYKSTHTRQLNSLGGLIKRMPKSAVFFLIGAMAISGLPPFNGFISEFLIYSGLFKSLAAADLNFSLTILASIVGLALIGGLAVFNFTRIYGMVFLGSPRSNHAVHATEVEPSMLIPQYFIATAIIGIGLAPFIVLQPIQEVVALFTPVNTALVTDTFQTLSSVSITSGIMIGIIGLLLIIRNWQQKKTEVVYGPTWGCAYPSGDPALHQYTATSFADNFKQLAHPVVKTDNHYKHFEEEDIFPPARSFKSSSYDKLEIGFINKIGKYAQRIMVRFAVLQTGKIQHYLVYPLVFILVIFLLTYLKFI
tara:strand:- start:17482 stop:19497 length:2016 start_codon:yes stop_codon:yes gene_type:complete